MALRETAIDTSPSFSHVHVRSMSLTRLSSFPASGKLNLRQPGVDTTIRYSQELSRLSEEDLESDFVFWIDAGYACDH